MYLYIFYLERYFFIFRRAVFRISYRIFFPISCSLIMEHSFVGCASCFWISRYFVIGARKFIRFHESFSNRKMRRCAFDAIHVQIVFACMRFIPFKQNLSFYYVSKIVSQTRILSVHRSQKLHKHFRGLIINKQIFLPRHPLSHIKI